MYIEWNIKIFHIHSTFYSHVFHVFYKLISFHFPILSKATYTTHTHPHTHTLKTPLIILCLAHFQLVTIQELLRFTL